MIGIPYQKLLFIWIPVQKLLFSNQFVLFQVYTCEVLRGEAGPVFRLTPADDAGKGVIVAPNPTAAWRIAEQRVLAAPSAGGGGGSGARAPAPAARLCGAAYFGLANPSVVRLLLKASNVRSKPPTLPPSRTLRSRLIAVGVSLT